MAEEQEIHCPLCGKRVPSDADKCPFCSTQIETIMVKRELERVIERRVMRRVKNAQKEELITPEVPNAPIPEVKVSCPGCGMDLIGTEAKCPRCGVPLGIEQDMIECPECGTQMVVGAASCSNCGIGFEDSREESAEAPQIEEEIAVTPPDEPSVISTDQPEPVVAEITTGAVTAIPSEPVSGGRGLTNGRGAINGTGLVNGTGMINGTGLVNGTGMINGNKSDMRPPMPSRRSPRGIARWQFLAVLIALVIIIPTFIYISYAKDSGPYAIDGDFGDWDDSDLYSVSILTSTPLTSIDDWSVGIDGTRVYFYVSASNDIMSTTAVESIFLFVDSDGNIDTGYSIEGIGADYFLEVDGWNDSIQSSSLSHYDLSGDHLDWSAWVSQGSISHRLSGNELEAGVDLQVAVSSGASFVLYSQDQLERCAVSNQVPLTGGVLIVTQELSSSVSLSGVLPQSSSAALLTLIFECEGADGVVEQVTPVYTGVSAPLTSIASFSLSPGDIHEEQIYVDTTALSDGQFVSAMVTDDSISSSFSRVIVNGYAARAYIGSAPSVVYIDGAFGDWSTRTASDVDTIPIVNPNIDVTSVGVFNTTSSSSFYIKVDGEMCAGAYVPALRGKPVSGGGSVIPSNERRTAEDILRIYIDSDLSTSTGYLMSVESKIIGADYMIEVRGLFGEINSKSVYRYMSNSWSTVSATVNAALDSQRIEIGVLASVINGGEGLDFIIETTDWNNRQDIVGLDSDTMLALTGGIALSAGTKSWVVQSSIGSSASAMSYQRKLFYDGTNFWSLYWNGTHTTYEYSSDGGHTWTNLGRVFSSTNGVSETSLWYDGATQSIYVSGDNAVASLSVYVRKGTVNPSGHSIAWGNEASILISTIARANKNTYITKDNTGSVWVLSTSYTTSGGGGDKFKIRCSSTSSGDNVEGAWTDRGNLLDTQVPGDPKGILLPGKSGSGVLMWSIYTYEGNVESVYHDGSSWKTVDKATIYAAGASQANTNLAAPSGLIDANGVLHVVYGTGDTYSGSWKAKIQYAYNRGTAWSTPITLNVTGTYAHRSPTISLDSSTGNVYAMWLENTTNQVQIKKNVSGTWTFVTISQNSYLKYHLTSIYSAPGESYICCQWTQDTSGTYEVIYENMIPEFSEVVIPVFFMMMVFIVGYRHRSRKPKNKS